MSYKEEKNNQIKAKVLDAVKELPAYAASYILSIPALLLPRPVWSIIEISGGFYYSW